MTFPKRKGDKPINPPTAGCGRNYNIYLQLPARSSLLHILALDNIFSAGLTGTTIFATKDERLGNSDDHTARPFIQERRSIAEFIISGTPIVREIGSSTGHVIFGKGVYSSGLVWAFEQGNS
jgi:hypothetical protein